MSANSEVSFLNSQEAKIIDEELMSDEYGWQMEQLMELAGLSVATLAHKINPLNNNSNKVLIYVGPGNNGGDGLVAARHLKLFGYQPFVIYPKQPQSPLFTGLRKQCLTMGVVIETSMDNLKLRDETLTNEKWTLIIDSLFGYSFKGPVRDPFNNILHEIIKLQADGSKVLSVDIPSSWDVENGPFNEEFPFYPDVLLSLALPKLAAKYHKKDHWVGGRFMPEKLNQKYNFKLPIYPGADCITRID